MIMNNTLIPLGQEPGVPYGYAVYAPAGATKLLISIPGWGERGDGKGELPKVENVSVAHWIKLGLFPFTNYIVVTPQYKGDSPLCYHRTLYTFIQKMIAKYKVSPIIDMVGLSGGGNSVDNFVNHLKENNALNPTAPPISVSSALLISCGPTVARAGEYLNTKTWVIIGDQDNTFQWEQSKSFVDAYNKLNPAKPAVLTIIPFQGHEGSVWNNVTRYRSTYDWMLKP